MLAGVWVLGTGMAAGWYGHHAWEERELARPERRGLRSLREPTHRFTQPLVECDLRRNSPENRALSSFHGAVDSLVARLREDGRASEMTVYFREFNDGLWFSSGEDVQYTPASLRKVPLMVALLKQSERQPGLLDKLVRYDGAQALAELQNIPPKERLETGRDYPIYELIRRMIVYSDNDAYDLLMREADERILREVYGGLGSGLDDSARGAELRSVVAYSAFFRVLFNGSYLSWELSERALALLAKAEFRQGLVAGVPPHVPVAHKFGEHHDSGVYQFHHCGIVYYPEHPYLLCVMSRGTALPGLMGAVEEVSRLVYASVDGQHGPAAGGPSARVAPPTGAPPH